MRQTSRKCLIHTAASASRPKQIRTCLSATRMVTRASFLQDALCTNSGPSVKLTSAWQSRSISTIQSLTRSKGSGAAGPRWWTQLSSKTPPRCQSSSIQSTSRSTRSAKCASSATLCSSSRTKKWANQPRTKLRKSSPSSISTTSQASNTHYPLKSRSLIKTTRQSLLLTRRCSQSARIDSTWLELCSPRSLNSSVRPRTVWSWNKSSLM